MKKNYRLGVIGGGFMASAIVRGAVAKRKLMPAEICICEPDAQKCENFAKKGFAIQPDARSLAEACEYLLLAVKPQVFPEVAAELRGARLPVLISIMAGKTKRAISSALESASPVARVMPNLPCSVGAGMAGIDASSLAEEDRAFVLGLFSAVGKVAELPEALLDAVTGVSGSGPAYVYLFLHALVEAGMEQGLSKADARTLALQTVKGGVRMAERSGSSFDALIAAVSSKGGTTVAALQSFENDDFRGTVSRAVDAAVRRAKELSE